LAEHLRGEQTSLLGELEGLVKHVDHIKEIVAMQQSYASVSGVVETVEVAQLAEDALQINAEGLARRLVQVERSYEPTAPIVTERHKVLQILVNLIRNAQHALEETPAADKRLRIRISPLGSEAIRLEVSDNGVGIPQENLTRIFQHGFTTRRNGHGFGLHSGALDAKEMGGSLTAHSDGPGAGATFRLDMPLKKRGSGTELIGAAGKTLHESSNSESSHTFDL
jgi:C4-dicarboxylate-specific signal transduction histidine kinase